jgi:hypothetical protein
MKSENQELSAAADCKLSVGYWVFTKYKYLKGEIYEYENAL